MIMWPECTAQLQPNGDVLTTSRLCSDTHDHMNQAITKMVHTSRLLEDQVVLTALLQSPAFVQLLEEAGWSAPDTRPACTCAHNPEPTHFTSCPRY